ncbi:MAG TPA: hypothetical protein VGZ47_09590 [Gemmataceae bacterium]|jgi:hypothetical protein|nr:hypothetical protein [Gemmataceae bacterium]
MQELKLMVPTYYGRAIADHPGEMEGEDFGEPVVPILIHEADGIRILLGSHCRDTEAPDVQIERRPNGWVIFLHPLPGDEAGYVCFLDNGASMVIPETGNEALEIIDSFEDVPQLDWPVGELAPDAMVIAPLAASSPDENVPRITELMAPAEPVLVSESVIPLCDGLMAALVQAQLALAGDSNDDEHDALLALVEALEGFDPSTS